MRTSTLAGLALAAAVAGFAPAPLTAGGTEAESFAQARLAAFGTGDLDALVGQYADDAVIVTPQGAITGADNIRGMIEGILAEFGAPGTSFNLMTTQAAGDVVAFTWSAETGRAVYAFASDNFVLRDGKAAYHIFAAHVQPK